MGWHAQGLFYELFDFNVPRPCRINRVRPALALSLVLASMAANAQDARVTFLVNQLASAKDPRVRAQTVLLLGQTHSEEAVAAVCGVLRERESVVRTAAVSALGEIRSERAFTCLKSGLTDDDAVVRSSAQKVLSQNALAAGGLYLQVEPVEDKVGNLSEAIILLAEQTMKAKLSALGASIAPRNEDKRSALSLIAARKLKGFQIRMQLLPGASERGLKVEMLIMSYPEQSLKGTWNVKAAGGKPENLIRAMIPRVLDDAANDLEWTK